MAGASKFIKDAGDWLAGAAGVASKVIAASTLNLQALASVRSPLGYIRWLRNSPMTSLAAPFAAVGGSCSGFQDGLLLCSKPGFGGTMTLGNVVVTELSKDEFIDQPGLVTHEVSHTVQSAILGNDLYSITWGLGWLASNIDGYDPAGGGGCENIIERLAAPGGGYEEKCGW